MQTSKDLHKHLELEDNLLLQQIVSQLKFMQSHNIICGLYVGNEIMPNLGQPPANSVIAVDYEEFPLENENITKLIHDLKFLGYKCSRVHECSASSEEFGIVHYFMIGSLYFHVNYRLTLTEKLIYFICKHIFRRRIF